METEQTEFVKVYRKRYLKTTLLGKRFATFIKIDANQLAEKCFRDGKLYRCQIQTSSGLSLSRAFNFQLNRVRNRWNVGIKRTTGFVLLDWIGAFCLNLWAGVREIIRLVFGTRVKLRDLTNGAEFLSRTAEEQKDAETMIFASLAAILEAASFIDEGSAEITFTGKEYMSEVKGLTFQGGMDGTMESMILDEEDDDSEDLDFEDDLDLGEI